jgi:hypothetical protein
MTIEPPTEREGPRQAAGSRIRSRRVRMLRVSALAAVLLGVLGCGEEEVPPGTTRQTIAYDQVPENVRSAATKAIPGVRFDEAWKNLEPGGNLHSYEIRGRRTTDGKTREVRVSPAGAILEME